MYTKFQIAVRYYPEMIDRPQSALQRLRRDIYRCKELHRELVKNGYSNKKKTFTKREIELIFAFLGEPGDEK